MINIIGNIIGSNTNISSLSIDDWILASGIWSDNNFWRDNKNWID